MPSTPVHAPSAPRLLSMRDVVRLTTYARPSIYRLIRQGRFPMPLKLGETKIAFRADEVAAWLADRQRATIKLEDCTSPVESRP
ncbi:MAG: AlpA family phage regulatory protein [Hyphomicrobium sp.]|uniref:helix-turn-helix transcriptional regulator n=1 Tax=Hyphomicrobium sp. TaxID=82 RepID=UPI001322B155|nr:AlpA family phage regulatory protein [Hyphomicrobium sp.]KAB2942954.1 MAG: AlpA family phage regulatory protein [Hyphomicrobium sp.]MBZ0211205.1 AlpA family phage regulatory protein [Hyphomicrobium sp.]